MVSTRQSVHAATVAHLGIGAGIGGLRACAGAGHSHRHRQCPRPSRAAPRAPAPACPAMRARTRRLPAEDAHRVRARWARRARPRPGGRGCAPSSSRRPCAADKAPGRRRRGKIRGRQAGVEGGGGKGGKARARALWQFAPGAAAESSIPRSHATSHSRILPTGEYMRSKHVPSSPFARLRIAIINSHSRWSRPGAAPPRPPPFPPKPPHWKVKKKTRKLVFRPP